MIKEIFSPYLGTLVNFAVVLILGTVGTLVKKTVPERISSSIMSAMAICVIYIGISGILESAPPTPNAPTLKPELFKILVMIISMTVGTVIGELIDLDKRIKKLGELVGEKVGRLGKNDNFAKGFTSCSILFCVGAMTVTGAIESAGGNHELLLTKSVIDGVAVLLMSSSMGIGCAFSAFFVLVYQGLITFLAGFLLGSVAASTITYMSVTGSLIIVLLGTNILGMTKVKTANMVPAMFIAIGTEALLNLIF